MVNIERHYFFSKSTTSNAIPVLLPPENLFTHSFSQTIWRILPHPTRNEWALELRDADLKTVSWALLDLTLPGLRWHTTPEASDWWSTLTAFAGDNLYIHNYRFPDIPEPTDLLSVSATDGTLGWVLPGWLFVNDVPQSGTLIVTKKMPETIQYQLCDARSGLLLDSIDQGDIPVPLPPNYRMPNRYETQDIYFDVLSAFLEKIVRVRGPIAVDYLEANPYLVFSYYLYDHEKVAQYLLIVDRTKQIIYHERLGENRQGVGRDTIIWKADSLVCLRNSNEFISIKLTF